MRTEREVQQDVFLTIVERKLKEYEGIKKTNNWKVHCSITGNQINAKFEIMVGSLLTVYALGSCVNNKLNDGFIQIDISYSPFRLRITPEISVPTEVDLRLIDLVREKIRLHLEDEQQEIDRLASRERSWAIKQLEAAFNYDSVTIPEPPQTRKITIVE